MTVGCFGVRAGRVPCWTPTVSDIARDYQEERRGLGTRYGMAIERLHFVFRRWHLLDEPAKAIRTLKRFAIPRQRGGRTVKVRQV